MSWSVLGQTSLGRTGLGATDCEASGAGWLVQPINAITSLAYVGAGVACVPLRGRAWWALPLAGALLAVGLGSFLFHGPQPAGSRWIHDVPVVVALAVAGAANLVAADRRSIRQARAFVASAALAVGLGAAAVPAFGLVAIIGAAIFAVASEAIVRRPTSVWAPVGALFIVALVLNVLGRSDGPWCDPESPVQLHAVWHVLTAAAFAVWAWRVTDRDAVGATRR